MHPAGILVLGILLLSATAAADTITVFAAASLKDALDECARAY